MIRQPGIADYQGIVDLIHQQNIIWPHYPQIPEDFIKTDHRHRSNKRFLLRLISEEKDRIIAFTSLAEIEPYNEHRQFKLFIAVHTEFRHRGIAQGLMNELFRQTPFLSGDIITADAFSIYPEGKQFLIKNGFYENWRETPVELNVSLADLSGLSFLTETLFYHGIQIKTLSELSNDPDRNKNIYTLYNDLAKTVPAEDGYIFPTPDYNEWLNDHILAEDVVPDAYLIALHHHRYIGLKEVFIDKTNNELQCGLMAVLPEFRRKNIALCLQLNTIAYARRAHCHKLLSCTATCNLPMQNLYARLGYQRLYDWYQMYREIKPEDMI